MSWRMIETSSVLSTRKSSEILPGLRTTLRKKCSESVRKSSVNRQKVVISKNNTWLLVDIEFLFSCLT